MHPRNRKGFPVSYFTLGFVVYFCSCPLVSWGWRLCASCILSARARLATELGWPGFKDGETEEKGGGRGVRSGCVSLTVAPIERIQAERCGAVEPNPKVSNARKNLFEQQGKPEELDRSFDLRFWQAQTPAAQVNAAWELVEHYAKVKGLDVRQLRLQRTVETYGRQQRGS